MEQITIQKAKTHLSRLVRRVEAGEEIIISRGRSAVARLVPLGSNDTRGRVFGAAAGRYETPPDDAFAELDEKELRRWE